MNWSSSCYSLNTVCLEDEEAMRKVSKLLSSPSSLPSFSSSLLNSKVLGGKFEEERVMKKTENVVDEQTTTLVTTFIFVFVQSAVQ
jgi:hypothetical protein